MLGYSTELPQSLGDCTSSSSKKSHMRGSSNVNILGNMEGALQAMVLDESKRFESLSLQYDKLYDPPDELEQQMIASKKKLEALRRRLRKINETLDNAALRYLNIPSESSFAQPDSDSNIYFEEQCDPDDIPVIKSGSLEKLVERVTFDEYADPSFLLEFLLTYRTFTTSEKLLSLIIERYHYPIPDNLSEEKLEKLKATILTPVHIRVVNFLKSWVNMFFEDFSENETLLVQMETFVGELLMAGEESVKSVMAAIKRQRANKGEKELVFSMPPPHIIVPDDPITLASLDPLEFARQMTLLEHSLYRRISPTDLADLACGKEPGEESSVTKFINQFNSMSNWVTTTLVSCESQHERKEMLCRFIDIANCCLELNNYNGVFEFLAALEGSSLRRLKVTWGLVPPEHREVYAGLERIVDQFCNFKNYRTALGNADPPAIPYIGLYLTDLTFIRDGNPNKCGPNDAHVNMGKRRMITSVLREMQQLQQMPYCLRQLPEADLLLRSLHFEGEDWCYKASLRIEPRGSKPSHNKKFAFVIGESSLGDIRSLWEATLLRIQTRLTDIMQDRWKVTRYCKGKSEDLVNRLIGEGYNVLVCVGGDDTLNDIIQGYIKSRGKYRDLILAYWPLVDSAVAMTVGLKTEPLEYLDILMEGNTTEFDVGQIALTPCENMAPGCEALPDGQVQRYFLNHATAGASSALVERGHMTKEETRRLVFRSAARPPAKNTYTDMDYQIDDEKDLRAIRLWEFGIFNGRYWGTSSTLELSPDAEMSDGLLDIVMLEDVLKVAKLNKMLKKGKDKQKNIRRTTCKKVYLSPGKMRHLITVETDGVVAGYLPATVHVVENAVVLVVPKHRAFARVASSITSLRNTSSSPGSSRSNLAACGKSSSDPNTPLTRSPSTIRRSLSSLTSNRNRTSSNE